MFLKSGVSRIAALGIPGHHTNCKRRPIGRLGKNIGVRATHLTEKGLDGLLEGDGVYHGIWTFGKRSLVVRSSWLAADPLSLFSSHVEPQTDLR